MSSIGGVGAGAKLVSERTQVRVMSQNPTFETTVQQPPSDSWTLFRGGLGNVAQIAAACICCND